MINMNHNEGLIQGGGRENRSKEKIQILNKESLGFGHQLNVKGEVGGIADRALIWFNIKQSQMWVQISNLPPDRSVNSEPQLPHL